MFEFHGVLVLAAWAAVLAVASQEGKLTPVTLAGWSLLQSAMKAAGVNLSASSSAVRAVGPRPRGGW